MNIPETLRLQRDYFNSAQTRDITVIKKLLINLKTEILNHEDAIYDAIYKDFKKSKFETYLSEIGIVISEIDLTLSNGVLNGPLTCP